MVKISFLLILICSSIQLLATEQLKEIHSFGRNEGNLKMYLHPPQNNQINNKALVVVLHGCSQNAEKVEHLSGWSELADKYNFIVIYPEQKMSNNVSNCFNWFYKKDINPNSGESSSILEMINYMKTNYSIDTSKIFITGLSAGAAMTVNLLANSPETFNAGASLAGGAYGLATNFGQAAKVMINPPIQSAEKLGSLVPKSVNNIYPKLIIIHGTSDNTVDYRNANELIKQWTNIHNINFSDRIVQENFIQNPLIERVNFPDANGQSKVIFYKIKETGHTLPVDPGEKENQGGNTGVFATDCDFFSTYYIALDFGLISN